LETLVRPKSSDNLEIQDVDVEDQGKLDAELDGIAEERIELEKEDEFVKKLVDPKLPSQEDVKRHRMEGHVNFRNWCGVCVLGPGGRNWTIKGPVRKKE